MIYNLRAVRAAMFFCAPLALLLPAHAQDWDFDRLHTRGAVRWHHHHRPVRLYREEREEGRRDDGWQCLDEKTHVVGSQWADEAGAEQSARKAFMEEIRFRFGEQFMDVDHAADYEKRCTRSSIGELAGQMLYRCEVAARACRPPLEASEGK